MDFGQVRDATAIAVVETSRVYSTVRNPVTFDFPFTDRLVVRFLERMRLGTEYVDVAKRVGQVARGLTGLGAATIVAEPLRLD